MVERGKLGLAAQCLERAAALAPHQDYVHRHLAIVKARISRLPPEQRDTEVFDDSFWQPGPTERNFNTGDISSGNGGGSASGTGGPGNLENSGSQFLGNTDSAFTNHHNHIGHKNSNAESLNNHIVHLKGPSKSAGVSSNEMKTESKDTQIGNDSPPQSSTSTKDQEEFSSGRVLDKNMNADATELTIDREDATEAIDSNKFDGAAPVFSTDENHAGNTRQKDTAFS